MTKDRRLGRGLAALLGSPLEEDQIIDAGASTSGSSSNTDDLPARQPPASRAVGATVSIPAANEPPRAAGANASPPARVTGAVPLKRESKTTTAQAGAIELSVYEIDNNPFQPRRRFNEEEIASLAESIREHQQLQPILVRKVGERFQLISGERRLRATIHAGLSTIRAEIREADDRLVAELAIVENLQRKDLDPIEKALSFRRYIDEHKCTQEDLAQRLKIDRSTIANLMRLMELPEQIQQSIQAGKLTAGHARGLLPLGDEAQQIEFAQQIMDEGWTVRDVERRVGEQLAIEDGHPSKSTGPTKGSSRSRTTPQLASLEQQLRLALGTKAEIRQTPRGRGKIVISFSNADEFERICSLICPQLDKKAA